MSVSVAIFIQRETSGAGGTFTSGAWRTRILNHQITDIDNIATLSSNTLTLQAGRYMIECEVPAFKVDRHQARLWDITNSVEIGVGTNAYSGDTCETQNYSFIREVVVLTEATTFRIEHKCTTTRATDGFGTGGNWSVEHFAMVTIRTT
jgi:hypothetical protein